MVPWAHPSPRPKWHLDRLSRFYTAHYRCRPTDRWRYSVCNNRPHRKTGNRQFCACALHNTEEHDGDVRFQTGIRKCCACALKNMQYSSYLWPNRWISCVLANPTVVTWTPNDSVGHNGLSCVADTTFHRTFFYLLLLLLLWNWR